MNKGALVSWQGVSHVTNFTNKKVYRVIAGQGDGVPRNNGTLGAYIQGDKQFVVEDDRGNCRVCSINSKDWKLVRDAKSNYVPKPEAVSPIVHSHHVSMSVLVQNAVVAQGEISQGDFFGHE